jgi:hypothetical protein
MPACARRAWLTLGALTVALEDQTAGYFCSSLDLGYPAVREVINNRPDQNGADDRTNLLGPRAVTANLVALTGAGAVIDDVADSFAPFMDPSARPTLHYVLDRPGTPERVLTVRAANYTWPVAGPYQRDIQLAFVAADPYAADPATHTLTAWAGSSTAPGRAYNLTYPRLYPAGGNVANTVTVTSPGDVAVRPLIRIYGPITKPQAVIQAQPSGTNSYVTFGPAFSVAGGHWVDVDAAARTVYVDSDPTQNALGQIDWTASTWPYIPPAPASAIVSLNGQSTSAVTQLQVSWNDRYLT